MSENRNSTITPSRREIALQLAAALVSNPSVIDDAGLEYQAGRALEVLNAVEKKLGLRPTRPRPGLQDE